MWTWQRHSVLNNKTGTNFFFFVLWENIKENKFLKLEKICSWFKEIVESVANIYWKFDRLYFVISNHIPYCDI